MKSNSWRKAVLIIGLFIAAYFLTRLFHLTILPIFTDEAIYIRWSQIGGRDASWRFISLVDGKQPMFTWIMMVVLRFIKDPLVAGRLVSVMAGAMSMVGMWFLSFEVFKNKRISLIACGLYLICPFTLLYDRLALYDSLVATFSIWNLYLAILLVRYRRLDIALILGMVLGAGMLNKSSGFLSLYLIPLTLFLFDWKAKKVVQRLAHWLLLVGLSAVLSEAIYSILRLSPLFGMISEKDTVFLYTFKEWTMHPFKFIEGNLKGLFDWLIHYLTWPVFIISFVPLLIFTKQLKEKLLLYGWWFAPFFALAMLGRVLYPRFILFMAMPLFLLAAYGINFVIPRLKARILVGAALIIFLFPSVITDYYLWFNPLYAPIPFSDKSQLIDDWPSGWGVKEVNAFITTQATKSNVSVYTEGTFGLFPYSIEMYQLDNPNVKVHGIWPVTATMSAVMLKDAQDNPTYMVFNQTQVLPSWPMDFIAQYKKGNRDGVYMRLFKIDLTKLKHTPAH